MKNAVIILSALFLSGCATSYQLHVLKGATSKLDRDKGVLIATPKEGRYGKTEYKDSGKMTASEIAAAFSQFSNDVHVTEDCLGLDCFKKMLPGKYAYYVSPEILHWEDRATQWSTMPDRIAVKISVYDATSRATLASSIISGENRWVSFWTSGLPEDLLAKPVLRFVESLY